MAPESSVIYFCLEVRNLSDNFNGKYLISYAPPDVNNYHILFLLKWILPLVLLSLDKLPRKDSNFAHISVISIYLIKNDNNIPRRGG